MRNVLRRVFCASKNLRKIEGYASKNSRALFHDSALNDIDETTSKLFLPGEKFVMDELFKLQAGVVEKQTLDFAHVFVEVPEEGAFYEKNLEKAFEFLHKRHPTLRAYFVRDEKGEPKRMYAEETEKIPFETHSLECNLYSPEFEAFLHSKIDGIDNQKKMLEKIPSRWYFIQALDSKVLFLYTHHGFIDNGSARVLANELHLLCHKLNENQELTFEEATKDFAKISSYEEVVRKYWETHTKKNEALVEYLKPAFEKFNPKKLGPLMTPPTYDPETSKLLVSHRLYSDASVKYIHSNKLNMNRVMLTIFQLALHQVFQVDSPIVPFCKLNGQRPDLAKGVACCYVREQVFFQEFNPENTLLEQYIANNHHNKKTLSEFGDLDVEEALTTLSQTLGKDCLPKICFNFVPMNPRDSKWIEAADFYDSIFGNIIPSHNLYFELVDDQRRGFYIFTLIFDKANLDSLLVARFKLYMMTMLDNLERLLQTKVGDMTEEKIINLLFLKKK